MWHVWHSPNEQLILDVVKGLRLQLSSQGSGVEVVADKELDNILLTYDLDPWKLHGSWPQHDQWLCVPLQVERVKLELDTVGYVK